MNRCVNIKSKEFKTLLDETGLASPDLELIVHKIQNSEDSDRFPTAQEVKELIKPKSFEGSNEMVELWEKKYSEPIAFNSREEATDAYNDAVSVYGRDSVKLINKSDGSAELSVGNPTLHSTLSVAIAKAKSEKGISDKEATTAGALKVLKEVGISLDNSLVDAYLDKVGDNNPYHQVYKQITTILKNNNIPINIVVDSNLQSIAARLQDGFKTATIRFNPYNLLQYLMTMDKAQAQAKVMQILTHELVHAVTAEVLQSHPSWAKVRGFDEAQATFNTKTWDLYEQCKEQLEGTPWYGLANAKEFIAEALTNRDFQIALSKIKIKDNNAFSRFVNYITDLFNKVFGKQGISISNTALEQVLSVSEEYFNYANNGINKNLDDTSNQSDLFDSDVYKEHEPNSPIYDKRDSRLHSLTQKKDIGIRDIVSIVRNSEYSDVIEALTAISGGKGKLLGDVKVKVINPLDSFSRAEEVRATFQGRRAYYDATTNTIHINAESTFTNGDASSVIMHEIMHAVTVNRIKNNARLRQEFLDIINQYREHFPGEYRSMADAHFIEEFIADIWSNKAVIEKLKSIQYKGEQKKLSLWDKIVGFFKNKLFRGAVKNSMFEKASNTLVELISSDITGQSEDRFFENESNEHIDTEALRNSGEYRVKHSLLTAIAKKNLTDVMITVDGGLQLIWGVGNLEYVLFFNNKTKRWHVQREPLYTPHNLSTEERNALNENIPREEINALTLGLVPRSLREYLVSKQREEDDKELLNYQDQLTEQGMKIADRVKALNSSHLGSNNVIRDRWGIYTFNEATGEDNILENDVSSNPNKDTSKGLDKYVQYTSAVEYKTKEELGGRLASTSRDGVITIASDVTVEDFFNYIQGKVESVTSSQKQKVLEAMQKDGYTLEDLRKLVQTNEDVQKLLMYHEFSHKFFEDASTYFEGDARNADGTLIKENIDWNASNKIEIEKRATENAIDRLKAEKEKAKSNDNAQQEFLTHQERALQQIDAITADGTMTSSEAKEVAEQAVFWISDHITRLQTEKGFAEKTYGEKFKDVDFSKMSRQEVVNAIGINNLMEKCKNVFNPEYNEWLAENADFDTLDKCDIIQENWAGIMLLAKNDFMQVENFAIVGVDTAQEDTNKGNADDFNESNDSADILEKEGNLQEHWQVESRSVDVISTMSQKVKRELIQCYELDSNGEKVYSEYGVWKRVPLEVSTKALLRTTQGALTLSQMIEKIKAESVTTPWMSQLLTKLQDKNNSDFQSQFFTALSKYKQEYDTVKKKDKKFTVLPANVTKAVDNIFNAISALQKTGQHPLFTRDGVNAASLALLKELHSSLSKFTTIGIENEENKQAVVELISRVYQVLGANIPIESIAEVIDKNMFKNTMSKLYHIVHNIEGKVGDAGYEPFKFNGDGNIISDVKGILEPVTLRMEDEMPSSFYDNGKMYQSYVTPSYMTKLFQKFRSDGESFMDFITEEYSDSEWFHTGNSVERGWRNTWLELMVQSSEMRQNFKHKVQLNFNGNPYMKRMSPAEYTMSVISEYFTKSNKSKNSMVPAWFRVPIMSNKPSSEFIQFYKYVGANYKRSIIDGLIRVMGQELSRIQTVRMRNRSKKDADFIKNFDTNGKKFCFLQELNEYLTGSKKDTELGKLINAAVEGREYDAVTLNNLAKEVLTQSMEERAQAILNVWEQEGIIKNAGLIANIGTTKEEVRENLENFIWNDRFAAMNILQLTITDIAYYKNAEDLQKRLGQLHSPGMRANIEAIDYEGNRVCDGKMRTIYLKDFENVKSNIIENVSIVMDRKIEHAKTKEEKAYYEALKDSLVGKNGAYRNINVTDGQGYSSITSYRKKALMFGKWSKEAEAVYQKIRSGNYTYNDLKVALQPLKPFVYTQVMKQVGVQGSPLQTIKLAIQNKNSEYLLLMADALTAGENTGKPNILRAIMEAMEESHYNADGSYRADGIDTIQFVSAVKSGETKSIDLTQFLDNPNGELLARRELDANIYERNLVTDAEGNEVLEATGKYNNDCVTEYAAEDYCLQQEIPAHFQDHEQAIGSQARYIIPSELAINDFEGNPVEYKVGDKSYTAEEFKKHYEELNAQNIEESINNVMKVFNLTGTTVERNKALSAILQKEILSDSRYGIDLLQACSVDSEGNFRIPLSDPIQSKRIEQLINSVIKNRVNKQEIAGGPIVQVTAFGTSKGLNVRYKDKNGKLLPTKEEYEAKEHTQSYEDYCRENQGDLAYYEAYAPIWTKELLYKFADSNGNISTEAIDMLDDRLLRMISYRIPSEDKYSVFPIKIVGFLPREAGDAIMLPNDITLLTGSD